MSYGAMYCRRCQFFVGLAPGVVVWTGEVEKAPHVPDGLLYVCCKKCRKFQRFEIAPPNPVVIVHTEKEIAA